MASKQTLLASSTDDLLVAARDGDGTAFAILYARYQGALRAHCRRILGDASAAEDVVQETFLRAWSRIGSFDLGRPVWPWLLRIAQRLCIDHWRAEAKNKAAHEALQQSLGSRSSSSPLDQMEVADLRHGLESVLGDLNPRYRQLLLLHALEGWSRADIAHAEGSSVTAVGKVLNRARTRARQLLDQANYALPGLFVPFSLARRAARALQRKGRNALARAEHLVHDAGLTLMSGQSFLGSGINALVACLATFAVLSVNGIAMLAPSVSGVAPNKTIVISESSNHPATTAADEGTLRKVLKSVSLPKAGELPRAAKDSSGFIDSRVDPAKHQTPENTRFTSIVPSPQFDIDHTVFAMGACELNNCAVLFVSRDAGMSWTRLNAASLAGDTILLPPSFPLDRRIFALGSSIGSGGFSVSYDGGESFSLLSPLWGSGAISPGFGNQDPRVVFAADGLFEYRDDLGTTHPASLTIAPDAYAPEIYKSVAFSPQYMTDSVILLSGVRYVNGNDPSFLPQDNGTPVLYRCRWDVCKEVALPGAHAPGIPRFSRGFDRDGIAYAFNGAALYKSADGARTFRKLKWPGGLQGGVIDLAISPSNSSNLYAALQFPFPSGSIPPGILRSYDGGQTWMSSMIRIPGFEYGSMHVAAVDGRVFAAGAAKGIACSDDGGRTWRTRCAKIVR